MKLSDWLPFLCVFVVSFSVTWGMRREWRKIKKPDPDIQELRDACKWFMDRGIGMEVMPGGDPVEALLHLYRTRDAVDGMIRHAIESMGQKPLFVTPRKRDELN